MRHFASPENIEALEELLNRPASSLLALTRRLQGDVMILGAGGKMGPSLARMFKRAFQECGLTNKVIAASRFSDPALWERLASHGVETISCDLLDRAAITQLPEVRNVFFLAGRKFGSSGNESLTWAMNTHLPSMVCEKFKSSRIVVFSTGNVYAMTEPRSGGASENSALQPVGEYAMSCLGRERIFEHFSRQWNIPMAFLRINYATELRYGVPVDIAQKVMTGEPIDLSMGFFNTIWLAEANRWAALSLEHTKSPPEVFNVTGPECLSVRDVAQRLGNLLHEPVRFTGEEAPTALLSNAGKAISIFGPLEVGIDEILNWVADWLRRGNPTLSKPTHFQARDGVF